MSRTGQLSACTRSKARHSPPRNKTGSSEQIYIGHHGWHAGFSMGDYSSARSKRDILDEIRQQAL